MNLKLAAGDISIRVLDLAPSAGQGERNRWYNTYMIILFILGLVIGAVAVVFTLQNVEIITVTFFSWQLTGSLALILGLAISTGVLVTILLILPESIKNYFKNRNLEKNIKRLEEELRRQKELTVFAKQTPPTPEIISSIERGVSDDGTTI